ncbi:baseplate assembly protein [Emcibacter sp.]|uniref:baseplate assembly protein n=1 Tax=Emcibacter sp. TaxID=1979954 RepID=UPI002AA83316|nr:baseplate J/gp47 family protein [Emcibacter sp.]
MTRINLSSLPAPDIIQQLDYNTILIRMRDRLIEILPALDGLTEADPANAILEVVAEAEFLLRQQANDHGRGLLLAYATGNNLDQLAAFYNIERLVVDPGDANAIPPIAPTYETDERLRDRILLAFEGQSTAGPIGSYKFHGLSADGLVKDIAVESPSAGVVDVTVLSTEGNGTPTQQIIDNVTAALNGDDVRPLTDQVNVQPATITTYAVDATLTIGEGPDATVVKAQAEAAVQAYVTERHRIGATVSLSGIYGALHQSGVELVTLTAPVADIVPNSVTAAYCNSITVGVA